MEVLFVTLIVTALYLASGGLLWRRWTRALPVTDPLYLATQGEVFSRGMRWALWTVCILFVLLWPIFATVRLCCGQRRTSEQMMPEDDVPLADEDPRVLDLTAIK